LFLLLLLLLLCTDHDNLSDKGLIHIKL